MKDDAKEFVDEVRRQEFEKARRAIAGARRLVIFTGAGASADSGIPTFRGASAAALWGNFDPKKLASAEGFAADPEVVYDWYTWSQGHLTG